MAPGPCFITNSSCMEIYIKLIFALNQSSNKYCKKTYLICNRMFKNIEMFFTIFDTSTGIVIANAFLDAIYCCFSIIAFGELSFHNFSFLALSILVVFLYVQNGYFLLEGVSITIFITTFLNRIPKVFRSFD